MVSRVGVASADFRKQVLGYGLTTATILYRMPDHPALLQSYIWQDYDLAPKFPVLIEFPDMATARRFYDSPEYRKILPIRLAASKNCTVLAVLAVTIRFGPPGRFSARFPQEFGSSVERVWQIQPAGPGDPGVIYAGTRRENRSMEPATVS